VILLVIHIELLRPAHVYIRQ